LMFLLFLIGLGTAHVNAQVRIGGNAAPNGAAVLDLNATDAATGTKGLALPRVRLDSATMQITPGVANLNGMLVYNTTATLGAGIYSWIGGRWKKVDAVPVPTPADSGQFLMSTGRDYTWKSRFPRAITNPDSITTPLAPRAISWSLILDTSIYITYWENTITTIYAKGVEAQDLCVRQGGTNTLTLWVSGPDQIRSFQTTGLPLGSPFLFRIKCYRPVISI